jgi:hypothetical protein
LACPAHQRQIVFVRGARPVRAIMSSQRFPVQHV